MLAEHRVHRGVERPGGLEIGPERLLQDHARALAVGQPGLLDRRARPRRPPRAAPRGGTAAAATRRAPPPRPRTPPRSPSRPARARTTASRRSASTRASSRSSPRVLLERLAGDVPEPVVVELVEREPDDPALVGQQPGDHQVEAAGDDHPAREVPRPADEADHGRVRLVHLVTRGSLTHGDAVRRLDRPLAATREDDMTGKADFTDEEWTRLKRAPFIAGMAISLVGSGRPDRARQGDRGDAARRSPRRQVGRRGELVDRARGGGRGRRQGAQAPVRRLQAARAPWPGQEILDELAGGQRAS